MGQGNTVVSHFVVQRGDFTVAIAYVFPVACAVLLSMRAREDFTFLGVLKIVCG